MKLAPMRQMCELLTKEKDSALKQLASLEEQMEAIITRIQVDTTHTSRDNSRHYTHTGRHNTYK